MPSPYSTLALAGEESINGDQAADISPNFNKPPRHLAIGSRQRCEEVVGTTISIKWYFAESRIEMKLPLKKGVS
jgi:hypothetical protein